MSDHRVAIWGLGLIGGSLALALKRSGWASRVVALERGDALPRLDGFAGVDVAVDVADTQAVEEALSDASITVLATPVSAIIATLPQALKQSPVVTDCGRSCRVIPWPAGSTEASSMRGWIFLSLGAGSFAPRAPTKTRSLSSKISCAPSARPRIG